MFFEVEKDLFLEGLSKTVPITEKRTSLPILSHILMEVSESGLTLTATDLEVGLRITCVSEVKESGTLAIPSKKLYEIVRELSPGKVSVKSAQSNRITIEAGHSTFELAGMDALDYPAWPSFEDVETASVQAEKLLHMIDKTMFAASTDDSRFNLNGIFFEQDEEKTRLVATDSHRLALMNEDIGIKLKSNVVVPRKGIGELRRILEGLKGEISVGFEQKNLFVRTDRFMITVRLIDGDYPDYRKVIPPASEMIVRANRTDLVRAVKRVATLTSERNKGVNVKVVSGNMEITTVHPDLGTARDVVDIEYEGEEFTAIVNAAYLIEALGAIDLESICLEFHGEGAPIIIRPDPANQYFNLVMPMRK